MKAVICEISTQRHFMKLVNTIFILKGRFRLKSYVVLYVDKVY